jgi:hypothetical protein
MRESLIERKCKAWAKTQGWLGFKFTSPSHAGVPDALFIRAGSVVFVEFKAPAQEPRPLQQHVINIMRQHGATVLVIDNFEDFKNAFA